MSTKRAVVLDNFIRRTFAPIWKPKLDDPAAASTALAVAVALLRALRDRGLLSEGEIDDLFGEAADRLRDTTAHNLSLLQSLRAAVEYKDEE